MSTVKPMSHPRPTAEQPAPQPRGWLGRNWRRIFFVLIVLPLLAATGAYFYKFGPMIFNERYRTAVDFLKKNDRVRTELGEPITTGLIPRPSGDVLADEVRLTFEISGPKGVANVAMFARKDSGSWGFPTLDVTPKQGTGSRIALSDAINHELGDDTPPAAPVTEPVKQAAPTQAPSSMDVNIPIPDEK